MARNTPADNRSLYTSYICFTCLLSAALMGTTSIIAVIAIGLCMAFVGIYIITFKAVSYVTVLLFLLLLYSLTSAILFGGIESILTATPMAWLTGEGRFFLYYWPIIFALIFVPQTKQLSRLIDIFIKIMSIMALCLITLKFATGYSSFSTHHAAGALCVSLVIYNFYCYANKNSSINLLILGISLLALLGTNSRTSLLALVLSIVLVLFFSGRIAQLLIVTVLGAVAVIVMPILFPEQFLRIVDAANMTTFRAIINNYVIAYESKGIEVSKAWEVTEHIKLEGNANLAIRGFLWGNAITWFVDSPLFGIGFGRFNDLGREFHGTSGLFYPVTAVKYASNNNMTAHNTFLHILCEQGIVGIILIIMIFKNLWKGFKTGHNSTSEMHKWANIGKTCLICLIFMGFTQHSLGAPIYGLTLMLMIGVAFKQSASEM